MAVRLVHVCSIVPNLISEMVCKFPRLRFVDVLDGQNNGKLSLAILTVLKLMLHEAIFRATCLSTPLRNELHEPLQRVTPRAMAKIVARQVADIAESKILFYFSQ